MRVGREGEAPIPAEPVVLSWSGGKDSALALARLLDDPGYRVAALVTTVTRDYDRISIHGVRRTLLRAQAESLGLPVHEVELEPQSSNDAYERAWSQALARLAERVPEVARVAFGDIFLEDVRAYREKLSHALGYGCVFPLWGEPSPELAREVLARGIEARLVCVDTHALDGDYAGRRYDAALLDELPPSVDPCGERGEFHTFVSAGPGFRSEIPYSVGRRVLRDERFAYCDLLPVEGAPREALSTAAR